MSPSRLKAIKSTKCNIFSRNTASKLNFNVFDEENYSARFMAG
jgi:hypothetical protein